jgi:hypothetical protein
MNEYKDNWYNYLISGYYKKAILKEYLRRRFRKGDINQ